LLLGTSVVFALRRGDAIVLAMWVLWLMIEPASIVAEQPARGVRMGVLGAILTLAVPAYAGAAIALVLLQALRARSAGGSRTAWRMALVGVAPVLVALAATRGWDARVALATEPSQATFHALYGLLLSPGRSVFVYSPLVLLGVLAWPRYWAAQRLRAESITVVSTLALVGCAARADWHGEPGYGPWLLLPLVPLWVEAAAVSGSHTRVARASFVAAALAGAMVQVLGVAVDAEAWPRLMADVRAATGAPGWFLDPAADTEFIPQLSPLVGQLTMWRLSHGAPTGPPPFSLVVGSDQAEPAGKNSADLAFIDTWKHFDKRRLRANLWWMGSD
jgi:hypothetical protein